MERIIAKRTLKEFWEQHPDSEQYLKTWYDIARRADWKSPNNYERQWAFIRFIGTHAQYDKIDATTI